MKKLMILGCVLLFVACMAKKPTVKTDGLEEVVVFGEDTVQAPSEEPLVPPPAEPAPAVSEAVTPPPVAETTPPPSEEVASAPPVEPAPVIPAPVVPPTVSEEPVLASTPPPIEEVASAAPVIPPAAAEEAAPPSPVAAMVPAPAAPSTPQGSVYGFRVQIFASSTQKNASKIVDDARASFGGRVYIEHLAPYYKVRIGDCLTKEDAQVLKDKAVAQGYRGAFIVETMINP